MQGFGRKPERENPLRRPKHGLEDIINTNPQEVGWEVMDWIDLTQGRDRWWALVNAVINLRVP
jgi:hypothetical protein